MSQNYMESQREMKIALQLFFAISALPIAHSPRVPLSHAQITMRFKIYQQEHYYYMHGEEC